MTDIAARIRAKLDEHERCVDNDCHQDHIDALRLILDECDFLDATGGPLCKHTAGCFRDVIGKVLGISDSPAAARSQPPDAGEPNWRRLALKLASAPLADYVLLTTAERDFIEGEVYAERERMAIAADARAERTDDAAERGPDA